MYFTPCNVVGEAFEPTNGTCAVSTVSLIAPIVAELTTPVSATTWSCLSSLSVAALPDSAVSPSSARTRSACRPPSFPPLSLM